MSSEHDVQIGVDIGGTFTDLLLFDERDRAFSIAKVLTTPDDPARAVHEGIVRILETTGIAAARVSRLVHGTTLITNALIERKGARTALITTRGFRDAVDIAREHRYDLYDLFIERPEPLVPRPLRFEVNERVLADGSVLVPLDRTEVVQLAERLRANGVEADAVALLHSYLNPTHEQEIEAILREVCPRLLVSTSADVMPEIREYERTSTTIANVYTRPVVDRYLAELERSIQSLGISAPIYIMLSSGGVCSVDVARRYPIRLIESGPAAGAIAAAHYGQAIGRPNLFAFDMGGTTAKACMIDGGQPTVSAEFEVNRVYRFKKGSGLPIQTPVIEMIEIGAGGGSIARIDSLGLLKVGPDSAGAQPGPASYGQGGERPTVTDADLVLGYLDPDFFLGGAMHLDRAAAEKTIRVLADHLGIALLDAAWGIHQVVNEQMAGAARVHAIEHGNDPRAYPLFAFGGAGPVHAYRVAEILHASEVVIPYGAGVTSAVGFLLAPLSFDLVRSHFGRLDHLDWPTINQILREIEADGRSLLEPAGVRADQMTVSRLVELRYTGQGHHVPVLLPQGALTSMAVDDLRQRFERAYAALYGRTAPGNSIEATNWRVTVAGPRPHLPLGRLAPSSETAPANALKGYRPIYLPEASGRQRVPVYDR
ncbi:MAG: hydantoinase/oxoprolinase family protein, partial [Thermomicrobiales bacterium]